MEFIQILTSNYNCEDKYMYENIKKVGSIKIIKYIEDNDVDSVIYYFWNYHLTNPKPIKIIINNHTHQRHGKNYLNHFFY